MKTALKYAFINSIIAFVVVLYFSNEIKYYSAIIFLLTFVISFIFCKTFIKFKNFKADVLVGGLSGLLTVQAVVFFAAVDFAIGHLSCVNVNVSDTLIDTYKSQAFEVLTISILAFCVTALTALYLLRSIQISSKQRRLT